MFQIEREVFELSKGTPMIIYGASYIGSVTGKAVKKNGIMLLGFMDRRAEEIESCLGLPVYNPEQELPCEWKDAIVFVAVKNVYYHDEIVRTLNQIGYKKVIYKTVNVISHEADRDELLLDQAYEGVYKTGDLPNEKIPVILASIEKQYKNMAIVREDGEYLIVRMPIEYLFTGHTDVQWQDVPILAAVPYLRIFLYFEGILGYTPDSYIALCQKGAEEEGINPSESWKKYVVQNRRDIYEQMRRRLELEPTYFSENAPEVQFNEKGYFNLCTGKHRVCFLAALGFGTAPVKVKREEWLHFFKSHECPMGHPYYMSDPQFDSRYHRRRLMKFFDDMYEKGIIQGNNRIIDTIILEENTELYYKNFFERMGFHIGTENGMRADKGVKF